MEDKEEEELVGQMSLFVNPSAKEVKKMLLLGAKDLFSQDKRFYNREETEKISKGEWLKRIEEIVGEKLDSAPLSENLKDKSQDLDLDKIGYLFRYEVGHEAKDDAMIYFLSDIPEENFPRCVPKKMVGEEEANVMFS